ncbi:MAG: serine hydrolase [Anaerolineae bacterium]
MKELIDRIEEAASEIEFSGVISIFQDASTVYNKAFGYRDVKNKLPNTTSTIFGIASGTKIFTALGIGVLIDQGVLSHDGRRDRSCLHGLYRWRGNDPASADPYLRHL